MHIGSSASAACVRNPNLDTGVGHTIHGIHLQVLPPFIGPLPPAANAPAELSWVGTANVLQAAVEAPQSTPPYLRQQA
jgi:hypothetical protein